MVDARASRTCDGHGDRLGLSLQARLGTRLGHQVGVRLVRHGHRVRAPESRESDETARRNPSGKRGGRLSSCTRRAARARQKRRRRGPSRRASEARARGRVWTAYVSSRGPRLRLSSAREIVRQSLSRNPSWTAVVDDSLHRISIMFDVCHAIGVSRNFNGETNGRVRDSRKTRDREIRP